MTTRHTCTGKIIIRHRINTIELLNIVPSHFGIEFDVREGISGVVVTHDAWSDSVPFEEFIKYVHHAFYIVNVKSEGVEYEVLKILKRRKIENFFLLDCSFPMIVRLSKIGERRIAIRVSEYESVDTAVSMKEFVDWIWLDSFNSLPSKDAYFNIKKHGFQLCVVSPELQGRMEDTSELKDIVDAVCTKNPELWF
jgi:hypothetical protein